MRLPRRRSSVAPGIGSLEAESDIEDGGKRRKRIPLQRVAAMPVNARVGTFPLAREAVTSVARLLNDERLKLQSEVLLLPGDHEVLAPGAVRYLGSELDEPSARHDGGPLDRLQAFGR